MRPLVPAGAEEYWLPIGNARLRFLTAGSGPPLLLVHGLMGYSFSWTEVMPRLARRFRVVAPDLLNTGFSDRTSITGSLGECADQLRALLDHLDLPSAAVFGSSHGGSVAMKFAVLHPQRVNALILASPAHPASEIDRWQIRFFSTYLGGWVGMGLYLAPDLAFALGMKARLYGPKSRVRRGTGRGYGRGLRRRGTIEALARQVRCWRKDFQTLDQELSKISALTLLLWGEQDRIVPVRTMAALQAQIRGSETIIMPDVGHVPYEEQPEVFCDIVEGWLARHSSREVTA